MFSLAPDLPEFFITHPDDNLFRHIGKFGIFSKLAKIIWPGIRQARNGRQCPDNNKEYLMTLSEIMIKKGMYGRAFSICERVIQMLLEENQTEEALP